MFTILKKELRSFLRSPVGIIFVSLSLALAGIATSVDSIYGKSPKTEYSLSFLSMALAVMLPIVIFNIFEKDRKNSADRLYSALGYKSTDVVLGKMCAVLALVLIETVILALFPVIFSIFGEINFAAAYLTLLFFVIFAVAMIAMNTFIAAVLPSRILYFSVSYVASVLLFFAYVLPTGNSVGIWQTVAKILRSLSPFAALNYTATGAIRIASIVSLVLFALLFTVLTVVAYSKKEHERAFGKRSPEAKKFSFSPAFAIVLAFAMLAASISTNFLPSKFTYIDISADKRASISSQTKNYLRTLDTDVTIYVVNPDSSDTSYEHMLELMDQESKHLDVNFVSQDNIKSKLTELGWDGSYDIPAYVLIIESDKRMQLINYSSTFFYYNEELSNLGQMDASTYQSYLSTVYQYAQQDPETYSSTLDSLLYNTHQYFCAEQTILSCIEYTALEYIPHPYYLTGHGETAADKSNVAMLLSSAGVSFESLDTSKNASIPADANCLIINAPTKDISEAEADAILSYLKKGGALTLLTNEANLAMPNLMSLVNAYGASSEAGIVCFDHEAKADEEETEETEQTEEALPEKNVVEGIINVNHDILYSLEGQPTSVKNANHIKISDNLGKSTIVTKLITTAPEAYIDGVTDSAGEKTLAVAIEDATANGVTEIAWFTGAESLEGEEADTVSVYATVYSILWGGEEYTSQIGSISPKRLSQSSLSIPSSIQLIMTFLFAAAIPTLVAVLGFVKYNKRRKARINL